MSGADPNTINQLLNAYQPPSSPNNGMLLPSSGTPTMGNPLAKSAPENGAVAVNDGGGDRLGATAPAAPSDPTTGNGRLVPPGGSPAPPAAPGNGRLTGPTTPAPAAPAAPAPYTLQNSVLGNGQNFQAPGSLTQQLGQANAINSANGIALPPSNYARWQGFNPTPTINTSRAGLNFNTSGYGPSGSTGTPGQGGSTINPGSLPGGGQTNPGGGVSQPGGGITTVTSPPGTLTPGAVPPSNIPPGGFGSPNTPTNAPATVNAMNQYFNQNYGNANQGNGNNTLTGFRFSSSLAASNPMAQQFNALMQQGNTNAAYSMLVSDNTGVGSQMLKSAMAGSSDPSLVHKIINTFDQGGTDAYFGKGVGYDPSARFTTGGHFDASGNFVGPQTQAQLQATDPGAAYYAQLNQNAAAKYAAHTAHAAAKGK